MMGRRVWRYPAEHVEKLTALCAEKLATQRDAAKQAKSERDAAARAAQRATRRAGRRRAETARPLNRASHPNDRPTTPLPAALACRQDTGGYVVRDANGQSLAYLYSRDNLTEALQAKVLTSDEATSNKR